MTNKKLFPAVFLLMLIMSFSLISATELKLIKVSELKEGDIMVDKNGNEIFVKTIVSQVKESKTIGQVISEKVFSAVQENKNSSLTGFAIQTQGKLSAAQPKIVDKIKSFFTGWFK
jgi:hypothetical protein